MAAALVGLALLTGSQAWAADYNASGSGNWSDPATWGGAGVPGLIDSARVESPGYIVTLDGGVNRTVSSFEMQQGGALARAGAETLSVNGQISVWRGSDLALAAGDRCYDLQVWSDSSYYGSQTVTTASATNVIRNVNVDSWSNLTLGANLNLGKPGYYGGSVVVGGAWANSGDPTAPGQLNMNGHNIVTDDFRLGDNGAGVLTRTGSESITARGTITVWRGSNLAMVAGDRGTNLSVWNDNSVYGTTSVTTASVANITSSVTVDSWCVLNLGANLNLGKPGYYGGSVVVGGAGHSGDPRVAGQLNMNGHSIVTDDFRLGDYGAGVLTRTGSESITARGTITVWRGSDLAMVAGDRCTNLNLWNDYSGYGTTTVTTASAANVVGSVTVDSWSQLTLGADLNLGKPGYYGGSIVVGGAGHDGDPRTGGVLNMNGHNIVTDDFRLGDYGAGTLTRTGSESITARGTITVWRGSNLAMVAGDRATNLNLWSDYSGYGTTAATTASSANVSGSISVSSLSTLTLGADLNLTGDMNVDNGGTVEAFGGQGVSLANLRINSGGAVNVLQNATLQGLTLSASDLQISSAQMVLTFVSTDAGDWAFRWSGDHQTALSAMLGDGRISAGTAAVVYDGVYTYIGYAPISGTMSVPEPATMSLLALGALAVVRRNRRK